MHTPRPYVERRSGSFIIREFKGDVDQGDLIWHQDKSDRTITVEEGKGWKLQMQEGLPFHLVEGYTYSVPAKTWHRLIRGQGSLRVKILEKDMRITESHLRKIIREEAQRLLEYEQILFRKKGKTYLGNDEGESEYYDDDPESHGLYNDGDSVPYEGGGYGRGAYDRGGPGGSYYRKSSYGRRRY